MPTTTGTSILGQQTLMTGASAPSQGLSIIIPSQPLPPIRRLGYFYLYQYLNASPFQCLLVEEGLFRAPGLYQRIELPVYGANVFFRLDMVWSLPGIGWSATIN